MRTTFDLPEQLVNQLKQRAKRGRLAFADVVMDILRAGLAADKQTGTLRQPRIVRDCKTGLPVISGGRSTHRSKTLTPERIAEILEAQEVSRAIEPA